MTRRHRVAGRRAERLSVALPKEVTTVRALPSMFGDVELVRADTDAVTSVVRSKETARPKDEM